MTRRLEATIRLLLLAAISQSANQLISQSIHCHAQKLSATWIKLDVQNDPPFATGFCDHVTVIQSIDQSISSQSSDPSISQSNNQSINQSVNERQRAIIWGGDVGGDDGGLDGVWQLDFDTGFETPTWSQLSTNQSVDQSIPNLASGTIGLLKTRWPSFHISDNQSISQSVIQPNTESDPCLILTGGHELGTSKQFNTSWAAYIPDQPINQSIDQSVNQSTNQPIQQSNNQSWGIDWVQPFPALVDGLAWSAACWGSVNQSVAYMYGGTSDSQGTDSDVLYRLILDPLSINQPANQSINQWESINHLVTGDRPPGLSGSSLLYDSLNDWLVLNGGYSCTHDGNSGLGSNSCFWNAVWIMPLSDTSTPINQPITQSVNQSDAAYNQTGNQSTSQSSSHSFIPFTWYAFLDPTPGPQSTWPDPRAWHSAVIHQTHNQSTNQTISQLWIYGGQFIDSSASTYYMNDVKVFDLSIFDWQNPVIKGAIPPVMWSMTGSLLKSKTDDLMHLLIVGGCTSMLYYSDVYALKLNTGIQPINCFADGEALHHVIAGEASAFYIQTKQANLDQSVDQSIDQSIIPTTTLNQSMITWGSNLTWGVQLKFDVFLISQAGAVSGRIETELVEMGDGLYKVIFIALGGSAGACAGVEERAFVRIAIELDGVHIPSSPFKAVILPTTLSAQKTSVKGVEAAVQHQRSTLIVSPADLYGNRAVNQLNTSLIEVLVNESPADVLMIHALSDGTFEIIYISPLSSVYSLDVRFDNQSISGSPFMVYPYSNLDTNQSSQIVMQTLAAVGCTFILVALCVVVYYRQHAAFKAASPTFLILILVGCLLAMCANYIPPVSLRSLDASNDTRAYCVPYAWLLSLGFTLAVSSLVVKTWRIARIFTAKKMQVQKISDKQLLVPVIVSALVEIIFNTIWLVVDPLVLVEQTDSSNELVKYATCASEHQSIWYVLTFIPKVLLLLYGVYLANATRAAPSAFNERQWIGFTVYNLAFCCVFLLSFLFLLPSTPSSIFLMRGFVVFWCVLATVLLMIGPKHHVALKAIKFEGSEHIKQPMPQRGTGSARRRGQANTTSVSPFQTHQSSSPPQSECIASPSNNPVNNQRYVSTQNNPQHHPHVQSPSSIQRVRQRSDPRHLVGPVTSVSRASSAVAMTSITLPNSIGANENHEMRAAMSLNWEQSASNECL